MSGVSSSSPVRSAGVTKQDHALVTAARRLAEPDSTPMPEVDFFFDPSCPWAWLTSRWITEVSAQTGLRINWRFLSLLALNEGDDYDVDGHTLGMRLLRIAAATRNNAGNDTVGHLYGVFGARFHESDRRDELLGTSGIDDALAEAGLPAALASAADDVHHDIVIREETEQALRRAGRDVGTPVITFSPPDGPSFFGPVISRVPVGGEAVELWECVARIADFPGFAELKRSIRESPNFQREGQDAAEF